MTMMDVDGEKLSRATADYEPRYDRFILHSKNYVQQYNQVYIHRLLEMREHMQKRVQSRWGDVRLLDRVVDIEGYQENGEETAIIGMIIKDLALRKSILDDYKDGATQTFHPLTQLASDRDYLILEDHSGRVLLSGSISSMTNELVSGIVVALRGRVDETGHFAVTQELFSYDVADAADAASSPVALPRRIPQTARLVLLASGLALGGTVSAAAAAAVANGGDADLSMQLLVDFICGRLADPESAEVSSRIVRVILAGDSVQAADAQQLKERSKQQSKGSGSAGQQLSTPSKQLDVLLAQCLGSCPADIMPGASDPANIALPQQPLHPVLFPHSARFTTLQRVTNPYELCLGGALLLGHSGQPLTDAVRQSYELGAALAQEEEEEVLISTSEEAEEAEGMDGEADLLDMDRRPNRMCSDLPNPGRRLRVLRRCLSWGHLCPTLPDSAPCYPFADRDPFVIHQQQLPRMLFAGNQPGYASEAVTVRGNDGLQQDVRLVCVPRFRDTGTVVLCDISQPSMPCYTLSFL